MNPNNNQIKVFNTTKFNLGPTQNSPSTPFINIYFGDSRNYKNKTDELKQYLSGYELERMNKLTNFDDQICYLVVHSQLKKYLGNILNHQTHELFIDFSGITKPHLIDYELDFNLSHSSNYFSFGISDNAKLQIGIDIEAVKDLDFMNVSLKTYFSDEECDYILQSKKNLTEKKIRFYEVWTCKEALLKMIGTGLSVDLKKICIKPGLSSSFIDLSEMGKNYPENAYIYSKRYTDFVVSVSLSEDKNPVFIEI
jgi:4'-phosphopantetheinyl transferase